MLDLKIRVHSLDFQVKLVLENNLRITQGSKQEKFKNIETKN